MYEDENRELPFDAGGAHDVELDRVAIGIDRLFGRETFPKVSSGGPPAEFNASKNAFVPRESRGSVATSIGLSACDVVILLISPP